MPLHFVYFISLRETETKLKQVYVSTTKQICLQIFYARIQNKNKLKCCISSKSYVLEVI